MSIDVTTAPQDIELDETPATSGLALNCPISGTDTCPAAGDPNCSAC
jgi:hypothetical protein